MTSVSIPPPPTLLWVLRDNATLASLDPADLALLAPSLECLRFPPSTSVVTEGDTSRDLYFVLHGEARIVRGGLDLGTIGPGGQFGELGLIAGKARAASVVSTGELLVACLSRSAYEALGVRTPALALRLVQAIVAALGDRLFDVTESVGVLLRERSLPRRAKIGVRLGGRLIATRVGTEVRTLLPSHEGGHLVVAALLDRKPVSLTHPISSDGALEPMTVGHWEGQRVYRRSLALLLLEAARRVAPEECIAVGHSMGYAQRVTRATPTARDPSELAAALAAEMSRLVQADVPLREEWWTVDEARAHFLAAGWLDAAALLRTWREASVMMISYGETYALGRGPILPRSGLFEGYSIVSDDDGLLLIHGLDPDETPSSVSDLGAVSMTHDVERWLATMGIRGVGDFNQACIRGDVSSIIRVSEGFQEKTMVRLADAIRDRGSVRVVCMAGPSSSGKTTSIKRLAVQLQVNGVIPVSISLDDYYVDRAINPKDERGEYDYETLGALQTELLRDHVRRLFAGETVKTAHYDFPTGTSHPEGGPALSLPKNGVLLLEGIHGLNPKMLESIDPEKIFRIFLAPLAQLSFDRLTRVFASDVRLLRRIVRDRHTRGTPAADNILRWPSVRRGERRHISPYRIHADAIFDSSLIYELCVLKVFAERYLLEVPQDHPAFSTAFRLLGLLDPFVTIYPDHVPQTSILREFIGGSGFEY